tara:strand:+ start:405 stop:1454 length:1050 start_codon:yes stop_codon:yes gene_type:complete
MQIDQQLTNNLLMKKHLFISFLGIFFGLLISYFIVVSDSEVSVSLSTLNIFIAILIGITSAYLIYFSALKLDKLLPWQKYEGNRLFIGIVFHFILSFCWISFVCYIYKILFIDNETFTTYFANYGIKLGIILFILILIFEVIYYAFYSYYSYNMFQIETVRQERKQIELQLKALKSQLSPHFLFNSLNTISSLVYKDENKAESFIRRLAEMYQYTLNSYQKKLITLKEELAFVNSYQFLLQTRFEDKFNCSITIDNDLLETKIPPLTLQMLLENAVKHNVLDEENPLQIKISSDKKYLFIQNNVTKKPTQVVSFKIGLKNINSRYLLIHNEGITVTSEQFFEVKIPVIR